MGKSATQHVSYCRLCNSACGVLVTVDEGRATKVVGDVDHPMSAGFTCLKGRALPQQHNHPERLRHSLVRRADGSFQPIGWADAAAEIADRLAAIIERHGPRAVALYSATAIARHPISSAVAGALWRALESPMVYTPGSIDQPGKPVATSLHGRWGGGVQPLAEADVWLVVGSNPFVSKWAGSGTVNPSKTVREGRARGMKLIVIDPRVTETATAADLHMRPRPGQDAVLLAGIIRAVLAEDGHDDSFCARDVKGLHRLRTAVQPFTPAVVEQRAGVSPDELREVVSILTSSRRGVIGSGTGLSMSGHGTLGEYLILSLQSILGFWRREGERPVNPGMLVPRAVQRAQAIPQPPAFGEGERSRVRGLTKGPLGMPTATLADEILLPGPGQVRALFNVGGNPVNAWPNQTKVVAAMEQLELLVCFDPILNETARMADYVIAPKLTLETPTITIVNDQIPYLGAGSIGFAEPFAMYSPAVVDGPPDVVQESAVFFAMARRLGLELEIGTYVFKGGPDPTDDEMFEALMAGAPVSFDELKTHPRGAIFGDRVGVVEPADPDRGEDVRLEVGHPLMVRQLQALADDDSVPAAAGVLDLIVRRTPNCTNSSDRHIEHGGRVPTINPAYVSPADARQLGVDDGDLVAISNHLGSITGVVQIAADVMAGTLSMAHGFGDRSEHDALAPSIGAPTNRLVDDEHEYDPYTGLPLMSALPVDVRKIERRRSSVPAVPLEGVTRA